MKKLLFIAALAAPGLTFAQLADSTQRLVHVQGAINFRDIGGYKTTDGKTVRWNRIFRSAAIDKLTDGDMDSISARRISAVIDFRGQQESAAAPDRLLPGTDYTLSPAGSDSLPRPDQIAARIREGGFLEQMYGDGGIPYFGERYRPLFRKLLVLNDSAALLYHCTGGRDRTGMATALLLYTLGVPQATIEADFTASNVYLEPMMGKMMAPLAQMAGLSTTEVRKAMELRPELIRIFFGALKKHYGSIDGFLEQEMGIGAAEKAMLRNKYTI